MKNLILALAFIACSMCSAASQAGVLLADYKINVDGLPPLPGIVNLAAFNTTTGLGTVTATFNSPGTYYFGFFVDHDIDSAINTFFNEFGSVNGTQPSGLSWEIDEPGFVFGDIYVNFANSLLDNSNGVPLGSEDDVSMALAWKLTVGVDEQAIVKMTLSQTAPTSGFYLTQTDPGSNTSIYFSSSLDIVPTNATVPEPSSWLVILGLAAASLRMRRKAIKA
ncbi:MAG: PEP-CTERM sorting domain-containing protein [Pirellulaceae bacterium]|nr:PEP-CTERM sorting domain-containing protein [Pirellulaceae bacterium]